MNRGQTILSLWDELNAMSEHQTLQKIKHFRVTLEILNGNYNELVHHLRIHNRPDISLKLMSMDNRELLYAYQKDITRLLHNYISSAFSLTDHARNHYRELYKNNDLFPDYQSEINRRFVGNPLAIFIKDLRQYFHHYQMPTVSTRLFYKKGAPDFEITLLLSTDALLKFSGWHTLSKEFLANYPEDIDLLAVIENYQKTIEEFYDWFIKRQLEIHRQDIEKVDAHKNKIRALEISGIVKGLAGRIKSIKEFEEEIFRFFHEEEISLLENAVTAAEKIDVILHLLNQVEITDKKTEETIRAFYNRQ